MRHRVCAWLTPSIVTGWPRPAHCQPRGLTNTTSLSSGPARQRLFRISISPAPTTRHLGKSLSCLPAVPGRGTPTPGAPFAFQGLSRVPGTL